MTTQQLHAAEVAGPTDMVVMLGEILAELHPSWDAWCSLGGTSPSVRFQIREVGENACRGRVVGCDGSFHLIEITTSRPTALGQVRHCVAHELAHVLIQTWVPDDQLTRGPAGEYAAERIGWEILVDAGLKPHTDVFVSPERHNQLAWLPIIARIIDEMRSTPWRPGDDDTPHLRARSRLFRAGWTLCRSEAYRRGQHDAGLEALDNVGIPGPLRQELNRVFRSLATCPFPAVITRESMHEFFLNNTPAIMAGQLNFALEGLASVVDAVRPGASRDRQAA